MNGSCLCGRVTIGVPGRPDYLNACNCALCWKLGTLWGYFPRDEVTISGETDAYRREDIATNYITADFCPHCGATTNWTPLDPEGMRIGVNMRLFDPAALIGVEVRYEDGRHDEDGEEQRHYRAPAAFDGAGVEVR